MPPTPTSALAFVTTVHLGLVVLRKHRSPSGAFLWALLPALLLCASPWWFPSVTALVAGLALHVAWFVACEKLVPAVGLVASFTPAATRPAAGARHVRNRHAARWGGLLPGVIMVAGTTGTRGWTLTILMFGILTLAAPRPALAQIGQLLSPGPLSRAHASLEGVDKCQKCHEPGRKITPDLCLSCHKPVADRIRLKKGVHREVTGDCAACHVEHAGADAELRPFDPKSFDHATETGFPLDGRHAAIARDCAKCHKTRSFLALTPACTTCHTDIHKPSLGADCRVCHSTAVPFKEARSRFDHSKAAFQLDRRPSHGDVREMPREPGLQRLEVRAVHRLPQEPASPADGQRLHVVPYERLVEDGARGSRAHRVPAAGQACGGGLREVPHAAAAAGSAEVRPLCDMPPGSAPRGLQAGLQRLPQ